jgi:hypothetical protein
MQHTSLLFDEREVVAAACSLIAKKRRSGPTEAAGRIGRAWPAGVRYEAKKTGKSKAAVTKAVKKVGVSRERWRNGWRAKTHKGCFTE